MSLMVKPSGLQLAMLGRKKVIDIIRKERNNIELAMACPNVFWTRLYIGF